MFPDKFKQSIAYKAKEIQDLQKSMTKKPQSLKNEKDNDMKLDSDKIKPGLKSIEPALISQ